MGDTSRGFDAGAAGRSSGGRAVFQVERGRATDVELAAVTVVLLCLLTAAGEDPEPEGGSPTPRWRPGWAPAAYRSPHCWR